MHRKNNVILFLNKNRKGGNPKELQSISLSTNNYTFNEEYIFTYNFNDISYY